MSDEPLGPDPDLAELFDAERASHVPEPMALAEVLARVEKTVLLATLSAGAAASAPAANVVSGALATTLRTKAIVALSVALAFGGGVAVGRSTAPTPALVPVPPAVVVAVAPPAPSAPATATTEERADAAPPRGPSDAGPSPSASPSPSVSAAPPADTASELAKEQSLVDTARSALARGRPVDALGAAEAHARRYPRGRLAEEREALAVQALAAAGRNDEARARAARFHQRFPQSIFAPAVDRSVRPP